MTAPYKKLSEVEWEDHFMTDKGKIRWIYTREKDDSPITVMQITRAAFAVELRFGVITRM